MEISYPILEDKYIIRKQIGSGGFSKVYLAKEIGKDELLAIKILKSDNKSTTNYNEIEQENLKNLNHPNIINIKDCGIGKIYFPDGKYKAVNYLVLEYAENAELFDYVYYPGTGFGEMMARPIFFQLVEAIDTCHKSKIAHRDLKTENIMMDKEWKVKLADFGFSKLITKQKMKTILGTYQYMAPELLRKQSYDGRSADVFSIGVILFILVTGIPPFHYAVQSDNFYKFFYYKNPKQYWETVRPHITEVSDDFVSLISSLLSVDPKERPSASQILEHPWLKGEKLEYPEYENEFERRKIIVEKTKEIQAQIEIQKKKTNNTNGLHYRNVEMDDELEIRFKNDVVIDLYDDTAFSTNRMKIIGSDYLIQFENIATFFFENEKDVKIVPDEEKAKFTVKFKCIENCDIELEFEELEIEVELKRVDDLNHIVEFTKISGDKYEFYERIRKFGESS